MSRFNSIVVLGLAFWLLTVSNLSSAEKSPDAGPKDRSGRTAIEKALEEPLDADFDKTPLQEVVNILKNRCKIEIVIDPRALGDVGIGADTPVTKELHNLSLRSALNLMLRDLCLTWTIKDDVLLITTLEEEENMLYTRVYDVSDLVVCHGVHDEFWDDYDTLIDVICDTVMPTNWDCVGGPGAIAGASLGGAKVLVVSQTYHIHCKIAELLVRIRKIAEKNPDAGPPRRNRPIPQRKKECTGPFISPMPPLPPTTHEKPADK